MIAKQVKKTRKSTTDSDSESDVIEARDWTNVLSSVQQMYITLEYKRNNGYRSDNNVTHINPDEFQFLKKRCKKEEKCIKKH